MATASLGGMSRQRAEWIYEAFPHHWLEAVDHDNLPDGLREPLITALVEGRSYNIPFTANTYGGTGITMIAVAVDELRQPVFTVHMAEFAVNGNLTRQLTNRVREQLIEKRRFTDEEIFELLWEVHNFLREHKEASQEGDARFIISLTMAWTGALREFGHSDLRNWKRMFFGRFPADYEYPLVKFIEVDGFFDEETSKALNDKLRTVVEF